MGSPIADAVKPRPLAPAFAISQYANDVLSSQVVAVVVEPSSKPVRHVVEQHSENDLGRKFTLFDH